MWRTFRSLFGRWTQATIAVVLGVLCVWLALAGYWVVLLDSHEAQRRYAAQQTWLRVEQMAQAISVQVQTLLSGLDYTSRQLAGEYADGRGGNFQRAVQSSLDAYPQGTLVQIAVADAEGQVVFSSLERHGKPLARVSIRDREHFQAHARQQVQGLFVGRPVRGRVSQEWTIQLSRGLYRDGRFVGVLVLSVSPDYIGRYFRTLFDRTDDVVLLVREDGAYLARSQAQDAVLGQSLPPERLQLFMPGLKQGTYETVAAVDRTDRLYAWRRVEGYPAIVSTGLERGTAFASAEEIIARNVERNAVGTACIVLGSLVMVWLALQRQRSDWLRVQQERRFGRLAQEVPGGLFQVRMASDGRLIVPYASPGFFAVHGVPAKALAGFEVDFVRHVHPEDQPRVLDAVQASVRAGVAWEQKYRICTPEGEVRWLHGQARPQQEEDGALVWHGYIHDITQDQAMQEATRLSEERLRLTVGAVGDGLWQWHWHWPSASVEWDARCYQMLGFAHRAFTLTFDTFMGRVHPADRARVQAQLQRHIGEGADFRVEMRLATADGRWLWVESRGEVTQRTPQGTPLRMLGTLTDIQQRVEQSRLIKVLFDRSGASIVMANARREILYANESAAQVFGIEAGVQAQARSFRDVHTSDESFARFGSFYETLKQYGTARTEWPLRTREDEAHWFDMLGSLLDPEDPASDVVWTLMDTDARHRAEAALGEAQHRLEALLEHFPAGILVTDAAGGQVLAVNRMLVAVLGLEGPPASLVGRPVAALTDRLAPLTDAAGGGAWGARSESAVGKRLQSLSDGRCLEVEKITLRDGAHHLGECWVLHDVTERRQRESLLESMALTDGLTGVPNRRAFMARLDEEIGRLRAGTVASSALLMLDIDHFKRVNDTYGHSAGDAVLKHLAAVITQALRKGDMVGRLGGEEFAVLLSDADGAAGYRRAESLREAVAACAVPVDKAGDIRCTISLGVCAMQRGDASAQDCLARADAALYASKRNGRNQSTVWSQDHSEATSA